MPQNIKVSTKNPDKLYFTYPNTVAVICTKIDEKVYIMPSVWQIPLSYRPMVFGILISPTRATYKKIIKAKNFSLNYFTFEFAGLITKLGSTTGAEIDKVKKYNLKLSKSKVINSPILTDAYVSIECKLIKRESCGDHVLFSAEVLNIVYDKDKFNDGRVLNISKVQPLLYLGDMTYTTIDPKNKIICKKERS